MQSLKPGQNTASTIHCLSQLQSTYAATVTGFAATQICLCIQAFLRSKDRESSLNQWPHNRLRETFTHFPIWDSYWDTIPVGDPRGLSKQGSGPAYHLSQQILACFGAILKWQADRRQRCSNILHLKSSLEIHLGNFSGFLITLFHVQRK